MYEKYLSAVSELNVASYRGGQSSDRLVMARVGEITVEYAPFDHIERNAELAIVGLTPGRMQAANALQSLSASLKKSIAIDKALSDAKRIASFSGPMRANLLAMLDAIGVPAVYKRDKAADFFSPDSNLVHFTSALRYPVYMRGENYSGSPTPMSQPILRSMIETYLAEEVAALPNAIWIPLGGHAETALLHLVGENRLDRNRVLAGLPHPSGANAERIAYFLGRKTKDRLSPKTNPDKLDRLKQELVAQIARLRQNYAVGIVEDL
jgi:hypothetical protein